MRKKLFLMIIMVMTAMNVAGQEQDTIGSVHPQEGKPTLMDRVHQIAHFIGVFKLGSLLSSFFVLFV